jgi:hypothetical protein
LILIFRPDLSICLGDCENYQHHYDHPPPPELLEKMEGNVREILQIASNLSLGGCIFVPGNHEPPKYYNIDQLPPRCKMLHGDYVRVCKGLILCGLGGCVPGYLSNGNFDFSGFPFNTDVEFADFFASSRIGELINLFYQQHLNSSSLTSTSSFLSSIKEESVLFLTHNGPSRTPLTQALANNFLYSLHGSPFLSDFFALSRGLYPFKKADDSLTYSSVASSSSSPAVTSPNIPDPSILLSHHLTTYKPYMPNCFNQTNILPFVSRIKLFMFGHTHHGVGYIDEHMFLPTMLNPGALLFFFFFYLLFLTLKLLIVKADLVLFV